jgi:hypothetical protein
MDVLNERASDRTNGEAPQQSSVYDAPKAGMLRRNNEAVGVVVDRLVPGLNVHEHTLLAVVLPAAQWQRLTAIVDEVTRLGRIIDGR